MTVRDVITSALQELGIIAAGEDAPAEDTTYGLSSLNDLLDQWAAERLQIYARTRTTWSIVASTRDYTVGTGGDVNIARPVYIDDVQFEDQSPTDPVEYRLSKLTDDAWARVPIKTLESALPTSWYYNPTFPLGALSFWPTPTSTTLYGVIYHPTAVTEFSSLDTAISLPPGYRRMLIKQLALDMASAYERQPSQGLMEDARESKAVVKRANRRLTDLQIESAALIHGSNRYTYSILTD